MRTVTVKLNHKDYAVAEGTSLALFVESLGMSPQGIAIAVNNEVIPKSRWEETILSDRLELMLIHAVSGG